jgi:Tfp pilus assembly protein PilN
VKAVNLMPAGGGGAKAFGPGARSSSAGTYVVLGVLAALVLVAGAWSLSARLVTDREAELARVTVEATAAEARAGAASSYQRFSELAKARVDTVTSLSRTRFDWGHAMREVSRVLPADVWLTSMAGTSGAKDEAPSATASAAPVPTFALDGCTVSQSRVARLMARLRAVDGVRGVELQTSEKADQASTGDTACGPGKAGQPKFTMSILFAAPAGAAAAAATATARGAPVPSTPAPAAAGTPEVTAR